MAKRAEIFLRVPQGPPGAPVAENKLLWKRRTTVAGQKRGQKESCFEAPVFYELLLPRPAPQPEPKKRREGGEGGREGGSRVGGWVEGGGKVGLAGAVYHSLASPLGLRVTCTSSQVGHLPTTASPSQDFFLESLRRLRELSRGP